LEERPNIVLIVSDTLRLGHLGSYGNDAIKTPNMDRLARNGVVFTNAFPSPCRPSR